MDESKKQEWTVDGLVSWVKTNTQHTTDGEALDALLWMLAVEEAEELADLTTKDLARMLLDGIKPMVKEDLAEWLAMLSEDEEEPLLSLTNWFGTEGDD